MSVILHKEDLLRKTIIFLFLREKESKQRKSNGKPLQVAHHDTKMAQNRALYWQA